jgi:SNF2 family DNA or RNA helicase
MAYAERAEDVIVVQTVFHEKDMIKSVPGSRWDPQARTWYAPLAWATCKALRGVFGKKLGVGPELAAWSHAEFARRVDPATKLRTMTSVDVAYHPQLFSFQNAGVAWAVTTERGLLGDDMGTGKTPQLIATTRTNHETKGPAFPALIVCPNSVKENWKREWVGPLPEPAPVNGWDPQASVVVIQGGAEKKRKLFAEARQRIEDGEDVVVVINVEAVRLHSRLGLFPSVAFRKCIDHGGEDPKVDETKCEVHEKELNKIPFRTVIFDEAHRGKDPKSKQTRAVWAVQHADSVRFCYAATGTPIANHIGDLWPVMHGVAPQDFPVKTKFLDRYALQSWNPFGGLDITGVRPDTRDEFFDIFDPRFRRMSKDLVLPDLPPKVRTVRYVQMKPKQAKAYRDIEEQMITRLDDGSVVMMTNNLAKNTRLLQFASSYAILNEAGDVRLSEPSPKIDALMEIIEDVGDRQIVVAAESRQLIELVAERFEKNNAKRGSKEITYRMITGAVTGDDRDRGKDDFQAGRAQVMLLTVKAGGVGITLTAADTIVFLQRSWSMIDNRQSEDRVHRIGSEKHESISVIDFVTEGTVEEEQIPKLLEKFRRLQEINRDVEVARANGEHELVARLELEMAAIDQTPLWTGDSEAVAA